MNGLLAVVLEDHVGAVLSVATDKTQHGPAFFHAALAHFKGLSHVTVEVNPSGAT